MIYEKDILFTVLRAVLIAICTLGMISALTTFKYSIKRVLCTFGVYLLWVIASSAVILHFFAYYGLASAFIFTVSIPAIYLAYRMDKNSLTQAIFNYATQIIFAIILVPVPMMINGIISGNKITHLLLYLLVYGAVIFLEYHFVRKPFQRLLVAIPTGWGIRSLIPIFFNALLANALENALEACRQEKEPASIELKARTFNGQYLMELSNTCRVAVQFDKDGLPLSHKGEGHGIGTRSMVAFAKEQNAVIYFHKEEDRFIMQLRLGIE